MIELELNKLVKIMSIIYKITGHKKITSISYDVERYIIRYSYNTYTDISYTGSMIQSFEKRT